MNHWIKLSLVTLFYLAQGAEIPKQKLEASHTGSQELKNMMLDVTSVGNEKEPEEYDAAHEASNKALIEEAVAKTYGNEAQLKVQKATELSTKSKTHKFYADFYTNKSHDFEKEGRENAFIAEIELNKASAYEKGSSELAERAREMEERVGEEENRSGDYLNNYIQEFWSSNVADNNVKSASAHVKNEDARAKGEYIKYAEMEKLANLLLNEAKAYDDLGKLAQENSEKYKKISEEKETFSNQFIAQALKYLVPKMFEMRRKSKNDYNSYLDNMLKAEREHELAREEQLKAAQEVKLANAYLKNAEQNLAFATLEKDRHESYKRKVEELSKSGLEPSTAEILVSSKSVVRKSVKVMPKAEIVVTKTS